MNECKHEDQKHTVWYWVEDGGPPIPMSATFDNRAEAVAFAESGIRQNNPNLRWIKIFRADNEIYTCFRWETDLPRPEEKSDAVIGVESRTASTSDLTLLVGIIAMVVALFCVFYLFFSVL